MRFFLFFVLLLLGFLPLRGQVDDCPGWKNITSFSTGDINYSWTARVGEPPSKTKPKILNFFPFFFSPFWYSPSNNGLFSILYSFPYPFHLFPLLYSPSNTKFKWEFNEEYSFPLPFHLFPLLNSPSNNNSPSILYSFPFPFLIPLLNSPSNINLPS